MLNKFPINSKDFDGPILLTGAGGCIGSWILALCSNAGVPVIAFDLSEDKRRLKLLMSDDKITKIT